MLSKWQNRRKAATQSYGSKTKRSWQPGCQELLWIPPLSGRPQKFFRFVTTQPDLPRDFQEWPPVRFMAWRQVSGYYHYLLIPWAAHPVQEAERMNLNPDIALAFRQMFGGMLSYKPKIWPLVRSKGLIKWEFVIYRQFSGLWCVYTSFSLKCQALCTTGENRISGYLNPKNVYWENRSAGEHLGGFR